MLIPLYNDFLVTKLTKDKFEAFVFDYPWKVDNYSSSEYLHQKSD